MTNMTIIDPDIVYFRLSLSGAFCITYKRFNYYFALFVAINLTLFVIYIVSMLHSDLSSCLHYWLNNSITIRPLLVCVPLRSLRLRISKDIFTVIVIFGFCLRITVILWIMFRSFRIIIVVILFRQGSETLFRTLTVKSSFAHENQ